MNPEAIRKHRLNQLAEWIKSQGEATMSVDRIIGKGGLEWGAKRETVKGYLEMLASAGLVFVDWEGGNVFWRGKE